MDTKKKSQRTSRSLHKPSLVLIFFRIIFKYLGALLPHLIGRWAYKLWFSTHRGATPKREQRWLKTATRIEAIKLNIYESGVGVLPVMTYYWENPETENAPLVMLLHGWTGRGSQMGAFVEPLLNAGFRVLSFDNHAHDKTPGKATHLFLQSAVQCALAKKIEPIYAVLSHSFGGMVTPYSLTHGMEIQKMICISPPSRFEYLLERFSKTLHLPKKIQNYMSARFAKEYGENLSQRVSSTSTSQQLGHIPALIIHDEDDIDVPITESELLHQAWPNSILQRTTGLGHRRILYDAHVIESAVDFIRGD